jgi:hypothetical protein
VQGRTSYRPVRLDFPGLAIRCSVSSSCAEILSRCMDTSLRRAKREQCIHNRFFSTLQSKQTPYANDERSAKERKKRKKKGMESRFSNEQRTSIDRVANPFRAEESVKVSHLSSYPIRTNPNSPLRFADFPGSCETS